MISPVAKLKKEKHNKSDKIESKQQNPFVLIFVLIGIIYLLTFILPSGSYVRVDGVLNPDSFIFVDKVLVNPVDVLFALPTAAWKAMGKLFITMMIVGGTLRIVQDTKALDLAIYSMTTKLETRALLAIPILIAFTGFLGTASVLISTVIAFVPLGITIARRLEVDNVFAVAVMFLGSYTGYMASPISPVSTAIAQEIAGIPVLSGFGFRAVLTVVLVSVLAIYLSAYAKKVRKDKRNSVMSNIDFSQFGELEDLSSEPFEFYHGIVLTVFSGAFIFFAYGSTAYSFGVSELASIMIPTAIICGLVGKLGVDRTSQSFIKGAQSMSMPILFMFFAMAISLVLKMGGIMDTVVHYASLPLNMLSKQMAAIGMFISNAVINLAIASGSGQAAVVMPIMTPLADVLGISRQVAVLAYQLGDGFTNLLNPINVLLIASLGMAKASMKDWFKLVLPLYGIFFVIISMALTIAVTIGWS